MARDRATRRELTPRRESSAARDELTEVPPEARSDGTSRRLRRGASPDLFVGPGGRGTRKGARHRNEDPERGNARTACVTEVRSWGRVHWPVVA